MKVSVSWIARLLGVNTCVFLMGCVDSYHFQPREAVSLLGDATGTTPPPTETQLTLRTYKPALAVRGAQCMICHANVQANIVTNFGIGTSQFLSNSFNQSSIFTTYTQTGATGHHTSENAYTNQREAWQSAIAIDGQVIIPKRVLTDAEVLLMTGVQQSMSLKSLMEHSTLTGSGSMISKVTPPAGTSDAILEKDEVVISYPTESEILDLIPLVKRGDQLVIHAKDLDASRPTVISGLDKDLTLGAVKNTGAIVCRGDVVIKGPLLLKNAVVQTNKDGCRLYVTGSVHIQGPLVIQGPDVGKNNVQIASSRAILLGLSYLSMGGNPDGSRSEIEWADGSGGLARFAGRLDSQYNPSGDPINGVPSTQFFTDLLSEARSLGSELRDAVEAVTVNEIPTGATVVSGRLAINYSGLMLNAPHVHSRYFGDFEGAIIADVAFLARNPAGQSLERFVYDTAFDSATAVLPAINRDLLKIR